MKSATIVVAMMAVLGIASLTMAKEAATSKSVKGTFERMQGETMIVSGFKDGTKIETPVVTTKNTRVTIDGETKTLADLIQGMTVKIKTPNGLATEVAVKTKSPTTKPSTGASK